MKTQENIMNQLRQIEKSLRQELNSVYKSNSTDTKVCYVINLLFLID